MATVNVRDLEDEVRELYSRADVAKFIGVSLRTVDNLVNGGHLKPIRILGRVMFRRADLMRLTRNGTS
ncbi:MAG: helix-turn-helix domain-containing protein [Terriglobales bacterium]